MLKQYHTRGVIEAGCDEAGRGCLSGPVVAAAVILPKNFKSSLLNDSKQLTEKQRDKLRPVIEEKAIAWGVGIVWNERIDEINILNASFQAMHEAVDALPPLDVVHKDDLLPVSALEDGLGALDVVHHVLAGGKLGHVESSTGSFIGRNVSCADDYYRKCLSGTAAKRTTRINKKNDANISDCTYFKNK